MSGTMYRDLLKVIDLNQHDLSACYDRFKQHVGLADQSHDVELEYQYKQQLMDLDAMSAKLKDLRKIVAEKAKGEAAEPMQPSAPPAFFEDRNDDQMDQNS